MYWHDINCLVSFLAYINRSTLNIYKLHYFPVNIFCHGKEPIETSHKCLILGKYIFLKLIQSNVPNHNHCLV